MPLHNYNWLCLKEDAQVVSFAQAFAGACSRCIDKEDVSPLTKVSQERRSNEDERANISTDSYVDHVHYDHSNHFIRFMIRFIALHC